MVNDMAKRKTEVSKIVLPTITPYLAPIYAVVGRECNIYFDNIIADSSSLYDIDVSCNVGVQQRERWTYTPSGARTDNITIRFIDKRTGVIVGATTTTITSVAAAAGSGNPKVIAIGDSTTSGMQVIGELKTLMDADGAMDVTLVGSQGTTHKHEGYSGWKVADFMVSGSPFYRGGAVNFSAYISDLGLAGCDIAIIHLGINDIFGQSTDYACDQIANIAKVYLDTLIASIKTYNAAVKIGIAITIPPSASQDAFGASYNCVEPWYRHKRNLARWWSMLIANYGGRTAESIWLVPYNTALDTEHNMSKATAAAWNSRTSETTTRQNNGVHPADIGYYQLADVLYAWIKAIS